MRKAVLAVMAIFVAVMFASVAVAATSYSASSSNCPKCGKAAPCKTCVKSTCPKCGKAAPCKTCAKPVCSTCGKAAPCACAKSGNIFQSAADSVRNIQAPSVPGAKPSAVPSENKFKRDVMGQKVPVETVRGGDALTDTATKYESSLITGKE